MKILIKGKNFLILTDKFKTVSNLNEASKFEFLEFSYNNSEFQYMTLYVAKDNKIYCVDIEQIPEESKDFFLVGNVNDLDIAEKISHTFKDLAGIILHNLSVLTDCVVININKEDYKKIKTKDFLKYKMPENKKILVENDSLSPSNLVVKDGLFKIYKVLEKKLEHINLDNILFEDFILSLVPEKYWHKSFFFLKSKFTPKIKDFFNTYNDIISLHIPIARSLYMKDFFEALLLQINKNFRLLMCVDGYDEKQKNDIIAVIEKYKDRFSNFEYLVNEKNLGVGKTRQRMLDFDKKSRYIVFLDDDNFLSSNAIDFLYKTFKKYPKMGMYSIENVEVRFDINYLDYVNNTNFHGVYTNRQRDQRMPLYCNQEETPLIHDRYYSDLLNIEYHSTFDNCSTDNAYNKILEIVCGNMDLKGVFQFMRIGHQFHQTREDDFPEKEFRYVMYILKKISQINNNVYYYDCIIKTIVPKQNELFKLDKKDVC